MSSLSAKPETFTDISDYSKCIGEAASNECGANTKTHRLFGVFPEEINGEASEFNYTYYNPFDPQYVGFLTVKYDDEEYEKEIERLEKIGINEDYTDYYSVKGEPSGYKLTAMKADSYSGFGYAIVPENEDGTITYAGIDFCNYFLDLDVNDVIPKEYLLDGFDATSGNSYENACMGR